MKNKIEKNLVAGIESILTSTIHNLSTHGVLNQPENQLQILTRFSSQDAVFTSNLLLNNLETELNANQIVKIN